MANFCLQIRLGKHEPNESGREYKFQIGEGNEKIPNNEMLDIIEQGIEYYLFEKYGRKFKT